MASDGSLLVNLTQNKGNDFDPSWSPDGRQIAFASNRSDGEQGGQFIYIMNADGSEVRQLSQENESKSPDWSPDGSRIVYSSFGELYVMPTDASAPSIQLTHSPEDDSDPSWSPDNQKIAWMVSKGEKRDVFVMNADGSQPLMITNNGQTSGVEWTTDGRIFTGWGWNDKEQICHNCLANPDGTDIQDAGGKGDIQKFIPYWTREGYRVELVNMNLFTGDEEIFLFSPLFTEDTGFGAGFLNLTNNPAQDRNPDWPDKCGTNHEILPEQPVGDSAPTETTVATVTLKIGYAGDMEKEYQRRNNFHQACDELQIECLEGEIPDLLQQGVNAIVLNSTPRRLPVQESAIQIAVDQKIPVFVIDAETSIQGAFNVTIEHRKWVKTSLGLLLNKIPPDGEIGYFAINPEYNNSDYIQDVLNLTPNVKVYEYRVGEYPLDKVKPDSADWINRNPGIDAIWTDYEAFQIPIGMDEAGNIPEDAWQKLVCDADLNGLETWQRIKDKHPSFDCLAVSNPPGATYDAVYTAYYLLSGMQLNPSALEGKNGNTLYIDFDEITDQNMPNILKEMQEKKIWYVDRLMSPEEIRARWFGD